MPTNLTPGSDLNATITVPNAGEDRTALSVRTPIQALADRIGAITDSILFTHHDSRRELDVQTGGTRTHFDIDIGAIASLVVHDGSGNDYVLSYAGGTATVTEAAAAGSDLGAVAKTWYIYAYRSGGGSLAWEVSDVVPNSGRTLKSTDDTRTYFGCFITDSSGSPIPMRAVNGDYEFRLSDAGTSVRALNGTSSATAYTDVDCSAFLPPHARQARFYASLLNADATNWGKAMFRTGGSTSYQIEVHCPAAGAAHDAAASLVFPLEVSSSRVIEYRRESASSYADIDVFLFVLGWKE